MLLYAVMRSSDGTADVALMAFVTCELIEVIFRGSTFRLITAGWVIVLRF